MELGFMALGNVDKTDLSIKLNESFYKLDPSEKNKVSYSIGTGLTKIFSEEFLDVPWLGHVSTFNNVVNWRGKKIPSKVILHNSNKTPKEPDLIGYDSSGNPHVLEAKGYSSGFKGNVLQHAINQVSQVSDVAGRPPKTKVACFNDLSKKPFVANIVDPIIEGNEGCSLNISFEQLIESYYKFFDSLEFREISEEVSIGSKLYRVIYLPEVDCCFGIDLELIKTSSNLHDFTLAYSNTNFEREFLKFNELYSENINFGKDGTFFARREFLLNFNYFSGSNFEGLFNVHSLSNSLFDEKNQLMHT
ncbi:hypothetical protein A6E12_06690 [Aliivibrio fischeri]|nr:hypothetical protein A6E12_06690 [Aliivibrio fischeri]